MLMIKAIAQRKAHTYLRCSTSFSGNVPDVIVGKGHGTLALSGNLIISYIIEFCGSAVRLTERQWRPHCSRTLQGARPHSAAGCLFRRGA